MDLETFRATKRRMAINDPDIPDHVLDFDVPATHAHIYHGECFILELNNGNYWLILERDDFTSANLAELEEKLFSWWISQ
jgi:hypothetical protein